MPAQQRVTLQVLRQELRDFASGPLREEVTLCLRTWSVAGGRACASDFDGHVAATGVPAPLGDAQAADGCGSIEEKLELNGAEGGKEEFVAIPDNSPAGFALDHDWSLRTPRKSIAMRAFDGRHTQGSQQSSQTTASRKSLDCAQEMMSLQYQQGVFAFKSRSRYSLIDDERKCFSRVEAFVFGRVMERVVLFAIFVNAVVLGLQTQIMATEKVLTPPSALEVIENVLLVLFALEVATKVLVNWRLFFFGHEYVFNIFDALLVVWDLISLCIEGLIWMQITTDSANTMQIGSNSMTGLRLFRLFRLVRIMRSVRMLKVIADLRAILGSITSSFRPFLGGVGALLLCSYVMAIFFTAAALPHRVDADKTSEELEKHYSSLFTCMLYMIQSLTGGIDWNDMVAPLIQDVSPLVGIIYCCYVVFCLLAVMNVITGIFVSTALRAAKEDQDNYTITHLNNLFNVLDSTKAGVVSRGDFKKHLRTKEMRELFQSIDLDPTEADCVFKLLDMNNSGYLNYNEFLNGCLRLRGSAKSLDLLLLLRETTRQYQKQTSLLLSLQAIQEKQLTEWKRYQEKRLSEHKLYQDNQHQQILAMQHAQRTAKPSAVARSNTTATKRRANNLLD